MKNKENFTAMNNSTNNNYLVKNNKKLLIDRLTLLTEILIFI